MRVKKLIFRVNTGVKRRTFAFVRSMVRITTGTFEAEATAGGGEGEIWLEKRSLALSG